MSRLLSGDLILSFVPEPEQRCWRTLTRTKYQLTRDRVRLQSQLESLLEECQIKLSSVVSDLLGASGQRILRAWAQGETDPVRLAELGDKRLSASDAELQDALSGQAQPMHRQLLSLYLARFDLIESQMASLDKMIAGEMKAHQDAVLRLAELPRVRNRFGAADYRGNRPTGSGISVSGPTSLMGRCVSRSAGKCWSIQQRSLSQGDQVQLIPITPEASEV